jgi:hypothetical protein
MIKYFKPMVCPICHEYYFTDDTIFEKQDPEYQGKRDDYCRHCGWEYDLYQYEHPDVPNLTNKLSLNEYKKWFQDKSKKNPNYDYLEENYIQTPHLCPVCGKYEFEDEDSFDICPYCGWEDDSLMESEPDKWAGCANRLCLNDYKKEYQEIIKENPNYKWEDAKKK